MRYNLGQNICRLFHVLGLFLFVTSEAELDYYHLKVNVRGAEQFKTSILGNQKISRKFLIFLNLPSQPAKTKFLTFVLENRKNLAVKHSREKPIFLSFVNLPTTFLSFLGHVSNFHDSRIDIYSGSKTPFNTNLAYKKVNTLMSH